MHYLTFTFNADGTGTVSFVCEGYASCTSDFNTTPDFTYTVSGDVVTVICGSDTHVFTATETTITCTSTTFYYDPSSLDVGLVLTVTQ